MQIKSLLMPAGGLLAACLALGAPRVGAQTPLQRANKVRVLTYNLHHGEGLDGRVDLKRTARVIAAQQPDVVALQEVDSCTQRTGGLNMADTLAAHTGLVATFARSIALQGGAYGVAILSRSAPLRVKRVPLPGREEARVLLMAEFPRYVLGCTHLSLTEADRMASLAIIEREARAAGKPLVLAGDLNAAPTSPFVKALRRSFSLANAAHEIEGWCFAPTFPADKPDTCIDYVGVYSPTADGLVPTGLAHVVAERRASDHRPVLARLAFSLKPEELLYHAPYLQNVSTCGATVMYQTCGLAHTWVEYGTDTLALRSRRQLAGGQEVVHDVEHRVRLDSLREGTRYYYRVCATEILDNQAYGKTFGRTVRTPFYSFATPTERQTDFTALVLNDMHMNDEVMQSMGRLAKSLPHDFVIFNGDCLPEPNDRDHAMQMVHRLADLFDAAEVPAVFLRGNHEIRNNYSSGMLSLIETPSGQTYHAFSWGDTRFVMLDCGEDKPDSTWVYYGLNDFTQFRQDQVAFLKAELKSPAYRHARRHILVHHIPLFMRGDYVPCRDLWLPELQRGHFDVSLNAHTHRYQLIKKNAEGNPYPVVIGGGPSLKGATMMVLSKRGAELTLCVLNARGEEIERLNL